MFKIFVIILISFKVYDLFVQQLILLFVLVCPTCCLLKTPEQDLSENHFVRKPPGY